MTFKYAVKTEIHSKEIPRLFTLERSISSYLEGHGWTAKEYNIKVDKRSKKVIVTGVDRDTLNMVLSKKNTTKFDSVNSEDIPLEEVLEGAYKERDNILVKELEKTVERLENDNKKIKLENEQLENGYSGFSQDNEMVDQYTEKINELEDNLKTQKGLLKKAIPKLEELLEGCFLEDQSSLLCVMSLIANKISKGVYTKTESNLDKLMSEIDKRGSRKSLDYISKNEKNILFEETDYYKSKNESYQKALEEKRFLEDVKKGAYDNMPKHILDGIKSRVIVEGYDRIIFEFEDTKEVCDLMKKHKVNLEDLAKVKDYEPLPFLLTYEQEENQIIVHAPVLASDNSELAGEINKQLAKLEKFIFPNKSFHDGFLYELPAEICHLTKNTTETVYLSGVKIPGEDNKHSSRKVMRQIKDCLEVPNEYLQKYGLKPVVRMKSI